MENWNFTNIITMRTEMNIADYINEILMAGGGVAATITAYVQGNKNAKSTELDNVAKAITIWQDTATELKERLLDVDDKMIELKKNHEDCEHSKRKLEDKVEELDRKVCSIKGK